MRKLEKIKTTYKFKFYNYNNILTDAHRTLCSYEKWLTFMSIYKGLWSKNKKSKNVRIISNMSLIYHLKRHWLTSFLGSTLFLAGISILFWNEVMRKLYKFHTIFYFKNIEFNTQN